jgi:GNAT superfamily N-acetyltransferase
VPFTLRRARPQDGPRFLALVQELASYEKMAGPTPEAEARLLADAFGPRPRYDLYLAEREGTVVAYAVVLETYSTFLAKPILYLEDVYVTPSARRGGVASGMMRFLAAEALRRGCGRLSWVVLDWNVDAQRFYERMGARRSAAWWPYAAEGEALARMAEGAPSLA